MFDAVNGALSFNRNLLEPDPNQDCTTDVVSDNSGSATLMVFKPGQLLRLSVKLLNLPAKAAHTLNDLLVPRCRGSACAAQIARSSALLVPSSNG